MPISTKRFANSALFQVKLCPLISSIPELSSQNERLVAALHTFLLIHKGDVIVKGLPRLRLVLIFSVSVFVLLALAATGSRLIAATNDNNVEWDGLFADQGPLYMNPIEPAA